MVSALVRFVTIAVGGPAALLAVWTVVRRPYRGLRRHAIGLVVLTGLAPLYAAPFVAAMRARGVWRSGADAVLEGPVGVPLGGVLAAALLPWLAGLWLYHVDYGDPIPDVPLRTALPSRVAGVLAGTLVGAVGAVLATPLDGPGLYLGGALAWAGPALALQWGLGGRVLWRRRSAIMSAVAVPSAYLLLVDAAAVRRGLWSVERRLGPAAAGIPVEDVVVAANLLVVQAALLWYWLVDRPRRAR